MVAAPGVNSNPFGEAPPAYTAVAAAPLRLTFLDSPGADDSYPFFCVDGTNDRMFLVDYSVLEMVRVHKTGDIVWMPKGDRVIRYDQIVPGRLGGNSISAFADYVL